ncbi:hypothetical protein ACHAXA_001142 [Cyclostephanos tholiformis]|uniref:SET domain-containing protein n=1 Tax=Cyclostephanos tholiformis TaxID=382380 RepID=A0ABD3R461_9STRA
MYPSGSVHRIDAQHDDDAARPSHPRTVPTTHAAPHPPTSSSRRARVDGRRDTEREYRGGGRRGLPYLPNIALYVVVHSVVGPPFPILLPLPPTEFASAAFLAPPPPPTVVRGEIFDLASRTTRGAPRRRRPLPRDAAIDLSEDADRDVSSFVEWASRGGIQTADGFDLVGGEYDGRLDVSAVTTRDMPAGSTVIYVPRDMILSSGDVMEEFGRLAEAEELLTDNGYASEIRQYYLVLKVLVELERGHESPWFAYLNSLPRYYSNGASMTLFCYTCIPPLVASMCKDERARLNNLSVKRVVPFLGNDIKGDPKLWKWAYNVVYTRGFEANDGANFNICPMIDYLNHGTENEVWMTYDDSGNCYAQATRDIPANTPLRMSYGDPTNPSFLLARYGFLDESSPATFCKIIPTHVSREMMDLGYSHNRMLFYKETGEVSEEVWDILLYMALGETDPTMQRQFYQAHMDGDSVTKQYIHEQYYPLTAAKLRDHIDTFLDDLDQLERKVDYGARVAADDHPRLPLLLRHNQFVRNTFLTVRAKQGLDQFGYS